MIAHERSADLLDVLRGSTDAAGVRGVVAEPMRHGVGEVLDSHPSGSPPRRLQLVRTKYKPSRKLTASYVQVSDGGATSPRHAVVTWTLEGSDVRTAVRVPPDDATMPQLERLTDARHVASLVESMAGVPVPTSGSGGVQVVRYRPGQRHVLLVGIGGGRGRVYVKTDRDNSGAQAVRAAAVMARELSVRYAAAGTAEPLGWVAEDAAALWWEAPGLPLSRLLAGRSAGRSSAVRRVGRALRVLHGVTRAGTAGNELCAPARDVSTEASSALGAAAHIAALLPAVGAAYTSMVSEVVDVLDRLPSEQPVLAHRDFKSDNILIHRGHPRILDFDRSGRAEPALDLGKFMADLSWWCPAPDLPALRTAFRAGYGPSDSLRWARAEAWAVLFELKIAARRCALHEPDWELQVRNRVAAASAALLVARGA